ncbi:hypothetical protein [Alloactinosynnema sp. L-07]|uniref:hypothetical protein n=1 Tax=Alloactinosynnema sp. L-07 TaxID=1653480 RepID=UPI00065EF6E1|nr:hypothetical protein [Alloactinosynnema sp. L-07]CRK62076.1 hypothetical protein [Alloactinosynnema sp. L-07]
MDAFRSIGHSLGDIVASGPMGAPPPAQGGGGKFTFRPAEIEAIVKDWLELAAGYETSQRDSRSMINTGAPGNEIASQTHASTARISGQAYFDSLVEKAEYCYTQAQKFQDALSDYKGVDRSSVRRITTAGDSAPSTSGEI